MREIERTGDAANHILLPVAAGFVFLAVLLAGALLG